MKQVKALAGALALALMVPGVALAHHSVSAQFDVDRTVMKKVVLSKVEWINPHTYMTFQVTEGADTYPLMLESMTPAALRRAGLAGRDALKIGETYTVYYSPSRNGNKGRGLMHAFTMPDGKTIGAMSKDGVEQVKEQKAKLKATN